MQSHQIGSRVAGAIVRGLGLMLLAQAGWSAEAPAIGSKPGQMFPDFMLPNLDGEHGRLSDYRGKKILLFHFASW